MRHTLSIFYKVSQCVPFTSREQQNNRVSSHDFLAGGSALYNLLNEQISSLLVDMDNTCADESSTEFYSTVFHSLLKSCQRLTKFHFCASDYGSRCCPVEFSPMNCQSAILTNLNVHTTSFHECLYLFDGHFPSLSTVTITVGHIGDTRWKRKEAVSFILTWEETERRRHLIHMLFPL